MWQNGRQRHAQVLQLGLQLNGQRGEVYGAHSTLGREADRFESDLPDCEHKDVLA